MNINTTYLTTDFYRVVGEIKQYPIGTVLKPRSIHKYKVYGTDGRNNFHGEGFLKAHPEIFEFGPAKVVLR